MPTVKVFDAVFSGGLYWAKGRLQTTQTFATLGHAWEYAERKNQATHTVRDGSTRRSYCAAVIA
jgi:hypothetical protein